MGIRGAVKKAAKKAGRGAANKVRGGSKRVAREVPGYGEITGSGVRENRAGRSLRGITRERK